MRTTIHRWALALSTLALSCISAIADPIPHWDVLAALNPAGTQVVTGWYDDATNTFGGIGTRVFASDLESFGAGQPFGAEEPGFRAVANPPAGSTALPGSAGLGFKIVPTTIGSKTSNLFYWDGIGPVSFTNVPTGHTLEISKSTPPASAIADGSSAPVPGFIIDTTGTDGTIHRHLDFIVDGGMPGPTVAGIYLLSMQLTMTGKQDSDPIYLVFNAGETETVHEAAYGWVNDNLVNPAVVPEPSAGILLALSAIACTGVRRKCKRIERKSGFRKPRRPYASGFPVHSH